MTIKRGNKFGQVTIFIIIAIVLISSIAGYFLLRDRFTTGNIPPEIQPIYTDFLSCIEADTLTGINVLESQAGYIQTPNFVPGSYFMPFSNQLNFAGSPIPYWYYVSANNIQKEQIPSVSDMETQLGEFIDSKVRNCFFDNYYSEGFEITQGTPKSDITITQDSVKVNLEMNLAIKKENSSTLITSHNVQVDSKLGTLYESARGVYDTEKKTLFLENYGVDILRLYAPVDGVEMTCSPKSWNANEVFDTLQQAIEANTASLKTDSAVVQNPQDKYFVVDTNVKSGVRFLNSRNWSSSFEVAPSNGAVMISKPVGNQPGLGILGFCYVPYHFVYNVKYPVLIQVFEGDEIFQFPVAVVIQGNEPREALNSTASEFEDIGLCDKKNTPMQINTFDTKFNSIDAQIFFECFSQKCYIGDTAEGSLYSEFPQCANGFIIAKADGFRDSSYISSTIQEGTADIILDKIYDKTVELKLDGLEYNKEAIITFVEQNSSYSSTIIYPEQKTVQLSQGQWEVQVYVYENSSIKLEETSNQQCIEAPKSGVGGLFGFTEKKCFDITIPSQIISNALAGGGKENYYILETELENSNTVEINAPKLSKPTSLKQLQDNYMLFENNELEIIFK